MLCASVRVRCSVAACLSAFGLVQYAAGGELHVPAQFPTIQLAINAALDGDEIVVAPGTYSQALRLMGKKIVVRSSGGPAVTIISGASVNTTVLTVADLETFSTVLDGFTFRDGKGGTLPSCYAAGAKCAGAIYVGNSSALTIKNCRFIRNGVNAGLVTGGAIYVHRLGALRVSGSRFEENGTFTTTKGLGTSFGGAIAVCDGGAGGIEITDTTFVGNYASHGGAVLAGDQLGPLVVTSCGFFGNTSAHGGGLGITAETPSVRVVACIFSGNHASHGAGAEVFRSGGETVFEDCTFTGNDAAFGAGLNLSTTNSEFDAASIATVRRCTFEGNLAGFGGGLYTSASFVKGLAGSPPLVEVLNCTFRGNTAGSCCDTGVYSSPCWLEGPAFGGGIDARLQGGDARIVSSLFDSNTGPHGAAISATTCGEPAFDVYGGSVSVSNCTIVASTGPGVELRLARTGLMQIHNSIVRGGTADQIKTQFVNPVLNQAFIVAEYSNIQGGFPGASNIDADPRFADAGGGDYRLTALSPCIDAGDSTALPPNATTDLAGQPRRADDPLTPDTGIGSPTVDMGAYEFQPPPCPADFNHDGFVTGDDFDSFSLAFIAGDLAADFDHNGFVTGDDFDAYVAAFEAGC